MFRRSSMSIAALLGVLICWQTMARGADYLPGDDPEADILSDEGTIYSGETTGMWIDNWDDPDILLHSGEVPAEDLMGTVQWSVTAGPGSVSPSSAEYTTLTGEYTTTETTITVQAVVDDSNTKGLDDPITITKDITLKPIKIAELQWKDGDNWWTVSDTLTVVKGGSITFKAIPDPNDKSFPPNRPEWTGSSGTSGASGTGEEKTVTFNELGTKTVTATCGNSKSATVQVVTFAGKLVPDDNFDGRSLTKVGVGETGGLEVDLAPGISLNDLKPLTWSVTAGTAITLSNIDTDNGTAKFTAGDTAGEVTLTLTDKNSNTFDLDVSVIIPSGLVIDQYPGTTVYHVQGYASVGFKGRKHLRPTYVSFSNTDIREQTCVGTATGCLAAKNGEVHSLGSWCGVEEGDITTGCRIQTMDSIRTGLYSAPFGTGGTFTWVIPNEYRVNGGNAHEAFDTTHSEVVTGAGGATISKAGHSETRALNDATQTTGW